MNNVCRTFCSINQSVVESLQHTATCWNKNKHQLAHQVDLATVMAEMFKIGDRNKDDVLTRLDFLHPNTLLVVYYCFLQGGVCEWYAGTSCHIKNSPDQEDRCDPGHNVIETEAQ